MDPNKVLDLIGDPATLPYEREQACADLRDWLRRGGFAPDTVSDPDRRNGTRLYNEWAALQDGVSVLPE